MPYVMDNKKLLDAIRSSITQLESKKSKSTLFTAWCPQQKSRLTRMTQSKWYQQNQFLDPLTVAYMLKSIMVDTPHSELAMLLHRTIADEVIFKKDLQTVKTGDEVDRLASNAQGIYRVNQTLSQEALQKDLPQFYPDAFKKVYGIICGDIIKETNEINQSEQPAKAAERRAKEYLGYDLPPLEARNRRASMGVRCSGR